MAKDRNMRITTPGDQGGSAVKRFVVTLLILVAIFYAGAYFGLKTEGARSLVEGWLGKQLGMDVKISEARLAFPAGVTVYDLKAGAVSEQGAGFAAEELRIRFLTGPCVSVEVMGGDMILVQDKDESWAPRYFSRMGDLPVQDLRSLSDLTAAFRDRVSVEIKGGRIRWTGENGIEYAVMDGIDFLTSPVKLPGRRMFYYRMAVHKFSMEGVGAGGGREILREWLAGKDSAYVEVLAEGRMSGDAGLFGRFLTEGNDAD